MESALSIYQITWNCWTIKLTFPSDTMTDQANKIRAYQETFFEDQMKVGATTFYEEIVEATPV